MVNKIWCRRLNRPWLDTKTEPPLARSFTEPRCQRHVGIWYLVYRWLITCIWLTIMICSMCELGSSKPIGSKYKWPIYLTSWDILFGAVQSLLGAFLVTRRWKLQDTADFDPSNMQMGKMEKVYWFFYTITSSLAFSVTISYWVAVYDPKIHQIDPLNIMQHVCNSLLMISDVCVSNIPLRLRYFWWCTVVVLMYLVFSVIYYSAGGLDKHGYHYIYKILDWKKPYITLSASVGGILFLMVVHCLFCYITHLWERVYRKENLYFKDDTPPSPNNELSPKMKDLQIV